METRVIEFSAVAGGDRVDSFCAEIEGSLGRSYIQKLIKDGKILLNGKATKTSKKIKAKDTIRMEVEPPKAITALPEDIPLDILYEDKDVIVVNKPRGMVVHPAPGTPGGTLVNGLLYHTKDLSGINGELRPGIVHRIDKDTSGILVVAKNDNAHQQLSKQLEEHSMKREYVALVKGILAPNRGTVNMPIGRDPNSRIRQAVTNRNSKEAITHFEVLKRYKEGYSLLKFNLETGRTHQIRVHMKEIEHPIAGDPVYGGDKNNPFETDGQLLHAMRLGFVHPSSGEYMEFETEPPEIFQEILDSLTES